MGELPHCHACGSLGLETFYEVAAIPVQSCRLVASRAEALDFPLHDLRLAFCSACGFVQNTAFEPERLSYCEDYEETQGFSAHFRRFQTELCRSQVERHGLAGKTLLEIGCGKGEFLLELCALAEGARGIGIDPSHRPERTQGSPAADRVAFLRELYTERHVHLRADYLVCRHTLEHIQPVRDFVGMLRRSLGERRAVVFIEVPDLARILEEGAFWDAYYEHCSYFTLGSLARLFRAAGFAILALEKAFHGQYLLLEALPEEAASAPSRAEEDLAPTARLVKGFAAKVRERVEALREEVEGVVERGERAVLWGSGSKAVSYLTTLGISDELEFVVDVNPHKHGRFLAGTGHEIVPPEFLRQYQPELVVAMNPAYRAEIRVDLERLGVPARLVAV